MKCRKCGIECIDAGFGHCKKCLAVPKFGITIREILQKVYNDGMLAGAKSTGKRNYENVDQALHSLAEIVRGQNDNIQNLLDNCDEPTYFPQRNLYFAKAVCDHIAKLFEEDK